MCASAWPRSRRRSPRCATSPSRTDSQHTYDLDTAQSRIDAAHAETDAVRTETEALRHRSAELESTLAELDAALAQRAAEIELLRGALAGSVDVVAARGGGEIDGAELEALLAEARSEASSVLIAEVELLRAQVQEHRANFEQAQSALRAAVTRAEAAEATAAKRGGELEEFGAKVREQITEVQRSRHELVTAAEATQHALELEKARADTAEAAGPPARGGRPARGGEARPRRGGASARPRQPTPAKDRCRCRRRAASPPRAGEASMKAALAPLKFLLLQPPGFSVARVVESGSSVRAKRDASRPLSHPPAGRGTVFSSRRREPRRRRNGEDTAGPNHR